MSALWLQLQGIWPNRLSESGTLRKNVKLRQSSSWPAASCRLRCGMKLRLLTRLRLIAERSRRFMRDRGAPPTRASLLTLVHRGPPCKLCKVDATMRQRKLHRPRVE